MMMQVENENVNKNANAATVDSSTSAKGAVAAVLEDPQEEESATSTGDIVQKLYLRKIIKENHGKAIETIAFNNSGGPTKGPLQHMLATAGGGIVSVYDNNHCGGFLDLSCVFQNEKTEYQKGGLVTQLAWVVASKFSDASSEEDVKSENEALLAFAGTEGEIGVLSIGQTRVIALLHGHTAQVTGLAAHPSYPGILASCSSDKTVRIWNCLVDDDQDEDVEMEDASNSNSSKSLVLTLPETSTQPSSVAWSPDGKSIIFGEQSGAVSLCTLMNDGYETASEFRCMSNPKPKMIRKGNSTGHKKHAVDCIEFLDQEKIMVHDLQGKIYTIGLNGESRGTVLTVPKGEGAASANAPTRFGISECRGYLCCGNGAGEVFIFDLEQGTRVNKLSMPRIKGAVTAAAFAKGCKNLALSTDDSILWRWDYAIMPTNATKAATK